MRQNRTVQIGLNSAHVVVYRSDCRYLPYSSRVFLSLCQYRSRENGQNTKILEVRHFRKYENGRRRLLGAQSINDERASKENQKLAMIHHDRRHAYTHADNTHLSTHPHT